MSLGLTIVNYNETNIAYYLEDYVTEITYKCSLTKPCREVHMKIPFAVFSQAFPAHYIDTGSTMEVYCGSRNIFRGKVITSSLSSDETLELDCFDYIWWLMRSKVCYNFQELTAKECIKRILDDLEIGYSDNGILTGDTDSITINRLIKNKTAYQAIMQICTELHRNNGNYYYIFMDASGNVGVRTCDMFWSNQTIQPCSDPTSPTPDGNMISFSYNRDMSNMVTRVKVYNSKGEAVDLSEESSEDDEGDDE